MALKNNGGVGLLAVGSPLLSVNALHHTTDDLQSAKHVFELPPREVTVLNLDHQQQGVGGDDSWGAWPHANSCCRARNTRMFCGCGLSRQVKTPRLSAAE